MVRRWTERARSGLRQGLQRALSIRDGLRRKGVGRRAVAWGAVGTLGIGTAVALALLLTAALSPLPAALQEPLELQASQSVRIEDRAGDLLREVRTRDGALSRWVPFEEIPSFFIESLVAVEDRHFYHHPGVDPLAILRASGQWLTNRRIISGASTLTMQLARAVTPRPRTLAGKFREMALALRIEFSLSKAQVLEQYVNRVDFGPQLRGVAAAAAAYFGRPLARLAPSELALLAGLPQAPSAYAVRQNPALALERRKRVLDRLVAEAKLSTVDAQRLAAEPLQLASRKPAFGAPHFVSALVARRLPGADSTGQIPAGVHQVRTTLDPELQRNAELAVSAAISRLSKKDASAAAAIAIDTESGEVLAYVGSPNFYAPDHGQVDGVLALRQPGSTLKPFVYATAFDTLGFTPASIVADTPLQVPGAGGVYTPKNFDERFRGPLRVRSALANSTNVPAVRTALALGPEVLLKTLKSVGFDSLTRSAEHYGPALALGDGEVSLLELVRAYAVIARGGRPLTLRYTIADAVDTSAREAQPLSARACSWITDILKDPIARAETFGRGSALEFDFDVAVKTGTSKGFRDNWVVGFTDRIAVGAWVGNFSGAPMQDVGGAAGAAPIFRAIVLAGAGRTAPGTLPLQASATSRSSPQALGLHSVAICPTSGLARGPHCPHATREWLPSDVELPTCDWHREVPLDRTNGLLAGPGCPASEVELRGFEYFPEEFTEWAHSVGRALGPNGSSPRCPPQRTNEDVQDVARIVSPVDGARFVIDPDRPRKLQRVAITVQTPGAWQSVTLERNGSEVATLSAPFVHVWQLEPGESSFTAVGPAGQRSKPLHVLVRDGAAQP